MSSGSCALSLYAATATSSVPSLAAVLPYTASRGAALSLEAR